MPARIGTTRIDFVSLDTDEGPLPADHDVVVTSLFIHHLADDRAADLLQRTPTPDDDDIDRMQTNLCRCGTYWRIRQAIHRAAELAAEED